MPLNILGAMLIDGPDVLPGWEYIKTYGPVVAVVGAMKYYFAGTFNTWERDMHGKVFLITGGTSGVGAQIAFQLATKGAQVILLTRNVDDAWIIDYVEDLREKTNNFLIYAEKCDLSSLHSVRKFATKWLDNSPPRRLDGIICCAAELIPPFTERQITQDGVERQLGINYLSHFHLLTLLQPSLTVQPPDRDVRVVLATCASQSLGEISTGGASDGGDLLWDNRRYPRNKPWKVYGTLKLLLSMFSRHFQKKLSEYERKDKTPCNVRVISVNPGVLRTASTRRFLSLGSVWGLILFWILFPIWVIFLKSAHEGSQLFMYAIFSGEFSQIHGGQFVHECRIVSPSRKEISDERLQELIYEQTEREIARIEKQSAIERAKQKPKSESKKSSKNSSKAKVEEVLDDFKEDLLPKSKITEDIYTMPKTPEELEAKLNILRQDLLSAATRRKGKK